MAHVGRVRQRADGRVYLDFGSVGRKGRRRRIYSLHGIQLTNELANRVLEKIRSAITFDDLTLDEALSPYLADSPERLISNRYSRWLELKKAEVESGDRSPTYLKALEHYGKPGGYLAFWDGLPIDAISYGTLEDFSLWLSEEKKLGASTRRKVLGALRAMLGWLHRRGELRAMPRDWPWPKVDEREPAILSPADQRAVLDAIPDDKRGIFLAMGLLGIRPGEARALDVADVTPDGWLVISKAVKGDTHEAPIRSTKTSRWRRLPLPDELAVWIAERVDPAGRLSGAPLFAHPGTGKRWVSTPLHQEWKAACDRAKVQRVPMYQGTKHTFATNLLNENPDASLEVVQKILGHRDRRSTEIYARLRDGAVVRALRPKGGQ